MVELEFSGHLSQATCSVREEAGVRLRGSRNLSFVCKLGFMST